VSEFNVQHMLQKFETGEEYHIDFDGEEKKAKEKAKKEQ
jgi:hypothetical protein